MKANNTKIEGVIEQKSTKEIPKLRMKYEKTKLVDFDVIVSKTVPSNEVPQFCPHKPLKKQGCLGGSKNTSKLL